MTQLQEALVVAQLFMTSEVSPALRSITTGLERLRRPRRLASIYLNPDFVENITSM
jgi:hypothetical protein